MPSSGGGGGAIFCIFVEKLEGDVLTDWMFGTDACGTIVGMPNTFLTAGI